MSLAQLSARSKRAVVVFLAIVTATAATASDIWIEPSVRVVRTQDWLRLSLMQGNQGNSHRDFKVSGKVAAKARSLVVIDPHGLPLDLTDKLVDAGATPRDGYWTANLTPALPGLYTAISNFDEVNPTTHNREVKCAKAYFLASTHLDVIPPGKANFQKPLGVPFEIVPVSDPVRGLRPGKAITVRVLYQGKPLSGIAVAFIPLGAKANKELDPAYQRKTGPNGAVTMPFREANLYLISAHYEDPSGKAPGSTVVSYSATICLIVAGGRS